MPVTALMILWAATPVPPLVVGSSVTAIAAVIAAVVGYIGIRRGARDTKALADREAREAREFTLIHESQDALRADNARLRADNVDLRAEVTAGRIEIAALREQVAAMRIELAQALAQHADCEQMRAVLERVVAEFHKPEDGAT